ncbi:MAG TPA: endolytic transglycosylase MltG [Gammaproteobacteria bacterium]|nr:endolytic transglycosylase MltG [Gammaproteobacteria bacterium]
MKRVVAGTAGIAVLLLAAPAAFLWHYRSSSIAGLSSPATVEIPSGQSLYQTAGRLHRAGVLQHPRVFVWMTRLEGRAHRIQAGEYRFEPGTTPDQVLDKLVAGKVVRHHVTLVEGWEFHRVMQTLEHDDALKHTLDGLGPEQIMARLGHPDQKPQGRFFPDTYSFPRGTTDLEILRRAYQKMQTVLRQEWKKRASNLPLKTPYQALTLASIIEKETGKPGERARIAGVFIRRLRRGMRLQTDPTVIYGMGSSYHGDLHAADLRKNTPYNTYVHKGLPPTPIAMPGRAAIHAALHPAPGHSLYFVAKGDGSHAFAATLKKHDEQVRRYQLHENN